MPRCRERPLTAICICWEIKCLSTGLDALLSMLTVPMGIIYCAHYFCLGFCGKQRQVHHCFSQTKQAILCTFHSISSSVMAFTYLHADGGVWLLRYESSHLFKSSFSSFICGRSDGLMVSALDSGSKAP